MTNLAPVLSLLSLPCLALPDVVGHFRVVINNNKSSESIRAGCFLPPLGFNGGVFFSRFSNCWSREAVRWGLLVNNKPHHISSLGK